VRKIKFLAEAGQQDFFANRATVGFEIIATLLPVKNLIGGATDNGLRPRERRAAQMGLRLSRLYDTPDARRALR